VVAGRQPIVVEREPAPEAPQRPAAGQVARRL
jgi:hypothetical protein